LKFSKKKIRHQIFEIIIIINIQHLCAEAGKGKMERKTTRGSGRPSTIPLEK